MDFDDGEFAYTKGRKANRIASLLFAAFIVGLLAYKVGVLAIRPSIPMIFPLAAIWFADELSESMGRRYIWLSVEKRPLILRWAGWFCLLASAFPVAARYAGR